MKKTVKIILIITALVFTLCGCNSESLTNNVLGATLGGVNERETAIQNKIEAIDGIYKATVVIRGKAAIIGIVLDQGREEDSAALKSLASVTAKKTDMNIKSTAVTCNGDINQMIENLKRITK